MRQYAGQVNCRLTLNHDFALKRFVQFSLGNIILDQSQLNQAETLFHSVIELSEQADDRYNQVNALWRLSKISEYRSQWDQQHAYAEQAVLLTKNVNDLQSKADNLYYLGSPSNSRLEFDQYIDIQQNRSRLEQYYHQLNDVPSQARTRLSMGQNYMFEFEQRIDFLNQAAQLYRQLNNKMQLAYTLSYTGFLYIQYHRGDDALIPLQTSFHATKTILLTCNAMIL